MIEIMKKCLHWFLKPCVIFVDMFCSINIASLCFRCQRGFDQFAEKKQFNNNSRVEQVLNLNQYLSQIMYLSFEAYDCSLLVTHIVMPPPYTNKTRHNLALISDIFSHLSGDTPM